jgi:hypothetical protein
LLILFSFDTKLPVRDKVLICRIFM